MLSRKLNNYIFYGSLALITIAILLANTVLSNSMDSEMDSVRAQNNQLQTQIEELTELVQDYKDYQTSQIYELYDQIPGVFSGTELNYQTISILEQLGITEDANFGRRVSVTPNVGFTTDSSFYDLSTRYKFVEVEVFFRTQDGQLVSDFVDEMYNSNQIIVLKDIEYSVPDGNDYLGVSATFLAMYRVETEEE